MSMKLKDRLNAAWEAKDCAGFKAALETMGDENGIAPVIVNVHGSKTKDEGTVEEDKKDDTMEARLKVLEDGHKTHDDAINEHTDQIGKCAATLATHDSAINELEERVGDKPEQTAEDKAKDEETAEVKEAMKEELGKDESEKAEKAKDSAEFLTRYRETLALAEVIAPGLHHQTMDAAATPMTTFKALCNVRRKALSGGLRDTGTGNLISTLAGRTMDNDTISKLPCSAVRNLFASVGATKMAANNAARSTATATADSAIVKHKKAIPQTIAELNARNRERYNK